MTRIPFTKSGFAALNEELQKLEQHERINVIRAISDAREFGDLSENAEYRAAKERQFIIENRIKYLKNRLGIAEVIDTAKFIGKKNIVFGAHVILETIFDHDGGISNDHSANNGQQITYQIVGEDESDIDNGKISISSPIAKMLIGKKEGEMCEFVRFQVAGITNSDSIKNNHQSKYKIVSVWYI